MKNNKRVLIKILKELSVEMSFRINFYAYDWIISIENGGTSAYINGYNFDINPAAAAKICDDKSAASEILIAAGLDCIEHHFFMNTANIHYTGGVGNWEQLTALLVRYKKLVVKPNIGSSGEDVFLVNSQAELEMSAFTILNKAQNLAVSKYFDIETEYRIIALCGEVLLIYAKQIPFVIGDGGHKVPIGWKFNLEQGAVPVILEAGSLYEKLSNIAVSAMAVLGMNFASVDIALVDKKLYIMEINSGVMMENFANFCHENYETAKGIYRKAVKALMEYTQSQSRIS